MANIVFQPAITEMAESTDRMLGVIAPDGTVSACSDTKVLGQSWGEAAGAMALAKGFFTAQGFTFKTLRRSQPRYSAFAEGTDEVARSLCGLAAVGLGSAQDYHDEKHGRETFVKNILLDNMLPGDIYARSREMGLDGARSRAVLLVRQNVLNSENAVPDTLRDLFPERSRDFVISVTERETVLIKDVDGDTEEVSELAVAIQDTLQNELQIDAVIGIGSVCAQLKDLAASYKEAQIAIEVGKVFDTAKNIVTYDNLGLGRLIYRLPTKMCEMFLAEVFKEGGLESLDRETLDTVRCFFENSLNISETSRKLFVHRNTLVYRLDKIRRLTGIDLREFDNAVTFKVAMLVSKYLAAHGA
ncbi:MAG: helix-turn-helix domain-containing protein [Oscillospiraceae bacterium]|jgi:carbohydrate diacid regulator|nr:helix-turn-helix domain-containing protein [Oscillospiraceae bacterium]